MTYNTNNPVPSVDVRDLYDNAQNLDSLVNGSAAAYPDRLGVSRKSYKGMELDFAALLAASGFELPALEYVDGSPLTVDRPTQLILRDGILYSVKASESFPATITGTFATDQARLVVRTDSDLRQDLASTLEPNKGAKIVALLGGGSLADTNQVVTPAMFGAVAGQDATVAIQAALDDPRPIVRITESYKVNAETRLYAPSNKIIVQMPGTTLEALPATSAFYSIFDVELKTDVTFINPTWRGDRDTHLGVGGEQGFGLRCLASKGVSVIGGDISGFWGDGLYFGAFDNDTHVNCEDIYVSNTKSYNNRRQGMSLTGVIGALVENSSFNDTNGTAPQSGVDIEPNAGFSCKDITFINSSAEGNAGAGFELLDALNAGNVENIQFFNCPARSNGSNGLRAVSAKRVTHTGEISQNASHGVYAIQGSTDLSLPNPNIHNNGGDGVQILTSSSGVEIGEGRVYSNAGYGVLANYTTSLDKVEIYENTLGGWFFGSTSVRSKAKDCYVHDNGGTGGESAAGSTLTSVAGGEYSANSKTTNLAAHNLAIYGNDCTINGGVRVRAGGNANKPAYGLRTTANSGLVVRGNDMRGGGATGDILSLTLSNFDISDNFPYRRSGTTAQRPTQYLQAGLQYYDETLAKPIWYFGGGTPWRDASGTGV